MSFLTSFLDKSISLPQLGNQWRSGLCADICEAARTVSYVETVGNKADTLHAYVSRCDERSVKRAYEIQIRKLISRLGLRNVELAIDGKQDLYYGEHGSLNVRQIPHEDGADEAWEYIVLSTVWPVRIPLMAVPYWQGADKAQLCIELLEFARTLTFVIKNIFFDRGFYNANLIDYLESAQNKRPLPYVIFVPQQDPIKKYIEQTKGNLGVYKHTFFYSKEKSTYKPHTTIVVCKNVGKDKDGNPYDWVFATNTKPSRTLVTDYRKRWSIETGFRIMEEGKIKTKSNNPLVRFFYFMLRALLTALWTLQSAVREHFTYKRYLRVLETLLRIDEQPKPPPIQPLF